MYMYVLLHSRTLSAHTLSSQTLNSAKDFKNRELFEKIFPELKARREQQERFTRYVIICVCVCVSIMMCIMYPCTCTKIHSLTPLVMVVVIF